MKNSVVVQDISVWWLYIVRCANNSFYTGITTNICHRLLLHNSGKGARYTRMHGPVEIVYFEIFFNRSAASKRESFIKAQSRAAKLQLVAQLSY
ncbi:MAG: GIY-YIG nuclease family protein [Patescibacteria group bacterium]